MNDMGANPLEFGEIPGLASPYDPSMKSKADKDKEGAGLIKAFFGLGALGSGAQTQGDNGQQPFGQPTTTGPNPLASLMTPTQSITGSGFGQGLQALFRSAPTLSERQQMIQSLFQ